MKNKNKKSLGKGLSALFGEDNKTEKRSSNQTIMKASISDLKRNNYQPRINFDEDKLNELSKSIKNNGFIGLLKILKCGSMELGELKTGLLSLQDRIADLRGYL